MQYMHIEINRKQGEVIMNRVHVFCRGSSAMMGLVVKSADPTRPGDMDNCWRAVLNYHIFLQMAQAGELNSTKGSSLKIITEPVENPH